jgi:hypothetical protein
MSNNGRRFSSVDVTRSNATFYRERFQGEPNHKDDEPAHMHGHNGNNFQGVQDEDPRYMRGYIQGFKVAPGLAAKGRRFSYVDSNPTSYTDGKTFTDDSFQYNQNSDDPVYMRGYISGFKVASEMWSRGGWKSNLPDV